MVAMVARVRVSGQSQWSESAVRVSGQSQSSELRFRVVSFVIVAAAVACGREATRSVEPGRPPDLLLITIDTLRADRVGRGLTPNLDALAARGLRFTRARAAVPLTLPSHVSMLTGALPPEHGIHENGIHVFGGEPRPIARTLKDLGYHTAAFVGAYVLDRRFGLAAGFDQYDDQISRDPSAVQRLEAERPANEVADRAIAWLRSRVGGGSDPIFLWVHFYDPHAPYRGSYDEEVKFADAQVGRLLQELRTLNRDPVVVATGDHGESLGDHGEATHGMLVYEAALHVPLIVAGPGITVARRDDPVSLVDVAPTLHHIAERAASRAPMAGRSLLDPAQADREIYAETQYPRVAGWSPVHTLVQDRWKLIVGGGRELYDLETDAAETQNLAASRQALATAMANRLDALRRPGSKVAQRIVSSETAERLRALGYVASSSTPTSSKDAPNPVAHIAAWGEFESALTRLSEPGTVPRLRKLASAFPDARVFQSTYARALSDHGAAESALTVYRRLVAKWPDDAGLFHELSVAARKTGRAAEALRAERAALALEPSLPSAHNGLGLLMIDAGRHAEAAAAFEAATKADPTNAEYLVNLGNAHRAGGNLRAAGDSFRRAAEIDPRNADAVNGLGVLLVQEKRAADAIPLFERAFAMAPGLIEARLNLGIALQESGQRDRAAAAYRDVLAHAKPGSPERRAASDLLRSLGQ
jgi:arylsulfatase A-like enzyme/Flp pilus assembly protein TadD